jgi:four helix bundle suffix protein
MAKIRPSGGYRELRSFQIATIIYDATYWFCERFLEPRTRMSDQMVQAARSGRQNIAEGSRASATSSQTELRLVNVARSSLEELLLDYEDYLRHRRLPQWAPESPEALAVRRVGKNDRPDPSDRADGPQYAQYARWLDQPDPAMRANALICLINQANYLLDRQIEALEKAFIAEGGYSEQLATARIAERGRKKNQPDRTDPPDRADQAQLIPSCPQCGKPMALRTAQKGKNSGKQFWGCTGYPECKKIAEI